MFRTQLIKVFTRIGNRVAWLRAQLAGLLIPGLTVDRENRFGKGVSVRCGAGARIELSGTWVEEFVHLDASEGAQVRIGRSILRRFVVVAARESVTIEDDARLAEWVTVRDHDHKMESAGSSAQEWTSAPVHIQAGVWCGSKATITAGVRVGEGAVVGANSVVTRDVPARTVVGGVPARELRRLENG